MSKLSGLSLFELLIVLLLVSLLFCFGLPLTTHWYQRQIAWVHQKDIEQAIAHGNQESVILGEPLRLVPFQKKDWSSGMVLLRERDLRDPKPSILYSWQWRDSVYRVIWHGFLSNEYLRFTPDLNQSAQNGYFLIENQAQHGVKLSVNRVGRVREEIR